MQLRKPQLEATIKLGDRFEFEDTNLTNLISVTVWKARTKRTYLMDKDGKTFELVKKARKK
jgi:hypothetical protein